MMPRSVVRPRPRSLVVKMIWHAFPRDGATNGHLQPIDYWVERGHSQTLGQMDTVAQRPHIAPDQVIVQTAEDGNAIYVYAQGSYPTG